MAPAWLHKQSHIDRSTHQSKFLHCCKQPICNTSFSVCSSETALQQCVCMYRFLYTMIIWEGDSITNVNQWSIACKIRHLQFRMELGSAHVSVNKPRWKQYGSSEIKDWGEGDDYKFFCGSAGKSKDGVGFFYSLICHNYEYGTESLGVWKDCVCNY